MRHGFNTRSFYYHLHATEDIMFQKRNRDSLIPGLIEHAGSCFCFFIEK